jgi:hypothetical protein
MTEVFTKVAYRSANVKSYRTLTKYDLLANGINLNGMQFWTLNGNTLTPTNPNLVISCNQLQVLQNFSLTSDIRLKENISDIPDIDIDNLVNLKGKQYTLINDKTKHVHFGYIAQDVEPFYPNLVITNSKQIKSINYMELIPLLIEKINRLELEIIKLKTNI